MGHSATEVCFVLGHVCHHCGIYLQTSVVGVIVDDACTRFFGCICERSVPSHTIATMVGEKIKLIGVIMFGEDPHSSLYVEQFFEV